MGGGLLLALNLGLILGGGRIGIGQGMAIRLSLLSAGLWWGGFSVMTFQRLRNRAAQRTLVPGQSYLTVGFSELGKTFRILGRLPHTLRYLAGYMLYNDGIQTVIGLSTVFLEQELFIARGLKPNPGFLLELLLMVQFVAFFGAFLFERIAKAAGTKNGILLSLVLWCGVVVYAYAFMQNTAQAWVMAGMIAIVLGGSQALSRSLFSRMIPPGREASFFGIYEISERGTSWIGPLIFGVIVSQTGSYRKALLSLIALFVVGLVILLFADTKKAEEDARSEGGEHI
jgi:UMF1 family MFS transporter